jgi:hypothetical protein
LAAQLRVFIISRAAKVSCLAGRLSSHVRQHRNTNRCRPPGAHARPPQAQAHRPWREDKVFDKRRARRGDDGRTVVTPGPGSFALRLDGARYPQVTRQQHEGALPSDGAARQGLRAGSVSIRAHQSIRLRPRRRCLPAPCRASRLVATCAAAAGTVPAQSVAPQAPPGLSNTPTSTAVPRSVLPNPSLERRPHEAGRLGRTAESVYHQPCGQVVLPRGSPQLAR